MLYFYIKNNKIEKIGLNLAEDDCELIDASNKVVSPGFIDMHSHADLTILEVNKTEATIMQGVTTLVVGMCGIGLAPANDKVRDYYYTIKIIMRPCSYNEDPKGVWA